MLFKYYYYIIKQRGNTMSDTKKIFDTYCDFVTKVTSEPSLDIKSLKEVIDKIENESPVVNAESSEAKNNTAFTTSSG